MKYEDCSIETGLISKYSVRGFLPQSLSSDPSVQSICLSHFQLSDIQVESVHSNSLSVHLEKEKISKIIF